MGQPYVAPLDKENKTVSAKSMFMRIFRIPAAPTNEDITGWLAERHEGRTYAKGDPASIPLPIVKAETPTEQTEPMPTIQDHAANHHTRVVHELSSAGDEESFCRRAVEALKFGDINSIVAGLLQYVAMHPAENMESVAA